VTQGEIPQPRSATSPEATFATTTYDRLLTFCEKRTLRGLEDFCANLKEKKAYHLSRLIAGPKLRRSINEAFDAVDFFSKDGTLQDHPCWVQNICAILYLLLLNYEYGGADPNTVEACESAFSASLRHFLDLSTVQVDALCRYLLDIRETISRLALAKTRIVLLDLPVGNSVPLQLLTPTLEPLAPIVPVCAVLNRANDKRVGVTREELLAQCLNEVGLRPNDIVVLLDEWKSGINFRNVCRALEKHIPEGTFFFPFAFQTDAQPSDGRARETYVEDCARHDAYLAKVGLVGPEFRRRLPKLTNDEKFTQYFFWAENDRMAAYRKMQVHGSFFSSIDGAIDRLRSDPVGRLEVLRLKWGDHMGGEPFNETTALELFEECVADYVAVRCELMHCADDMRTGGAIDANEIEDYGAEVFARINKIVSSRKASLAIDAAKTLLAITGSLDPADRFYFRGHAPIAGRLTGRAAIWNRLTIEYLAARRDTLAAARGF
jgi:hypothetical protein